MRKSIIADLERRLELERKHRGTGRTTRMGREARKAIEEGEEVWVVGSNHKHATILCKLIGGGNPVGVESAKTEFEGRGKISVFVDHSATVNLVCKYLQELKAIGGNNDRRN